MVMDNFKKYKNNQGTVFFVDGKIIKNENLRWIVDVG